MQYVLRLPFLPEVLPYVLTPSMGVEDDLSLLGRQNLAPEVLKVRPLGKGLQVRIRLQESPSLCGFEKPDRVRPIQMRHRAGRVGL